MGTVFAAGLRREKVGHARKNLGAQLFGQGGRRGCDRLKPLFVEHQHQHQQEARDDHGGRKDERVNPNRICMPLRVAVAR